MNGLDLDLLREVSARRRDRWHTPDTVPWTGADWGNAMGGECGEAQNVVKKLRRIETGTGSQNDPPREVLVYMLGDELADTIAYADLLADHYGIDLSDAIARKFNAISEREGFPERLPRREEHPAFDACPEGGGRVAEESETDRVSPALTCPSDAGSRERLDPLAATTPPSALGEIDRNARAYGWEIGHGHPLAEQIESTSDDNPFLNPDWRDQIDGR